MRCSTRLLKSGVLGIPLALYAGLPDATGDAGMIARGERLFVGHEPLRARIDGHPDDLPASFARCVNCHAGIGPARPGAAFEARLAPRLDHGALTTIASRRGGPPFAYDGSGFCRTIRTGIDPRDIVLTRAMPRFDADEAQCEALWIYLLGGREP